MTWPSWASPVRARAKYDKLKKGKAMLRFGGGFNCGKVEDVFVIYGCACVCANSSPSFGTAFTIIRPCGTRISLNGRTSAEGVLGGTDPKTVCPTSLRHAVFKGLLGLGLAAEPNVEKRCTHALGVRQRRSSDAGNPGATDHDQGVVQ